MSKNANVICEGSPTSLNIQVHRKTVIEQHTAHISYNGRGRKIIPEPVPCDIKIK